MMSALEQGSSSIFAGVRIYKKIIELLQNSASEGEKAHDKGKGREGGRENRHFALQTYVDSGYVNPDTNQPEPFIGSGPTETLTGT